MCFFLSTLEALNTNYRRLFDKDTGKDNERTYSNGKGFEKWGWIITLDNLSNGHSDKWHYYTELNVIEFLNICAYQKDKQKEQERQIRLQKLKNK